MSIVRRIGNWEVERSLTDKKVYISDQSGKLLKEFTFDEQFEMIEWIQVHSTVK